MKTVLYAASLLAGVTLALGPRAGPSQPAPKPPEQGPAPAVRPARAERLDLYRDPLPPQATARLGTVRFRHHQAVRAVAFSPDGKVLATVDVGVDSIHLGGSLRFWDRASGRELHPLVPGPSGYVISAVFAADGKVLFVGTREGPLRRWDLTSGKELPPWKGHARGVRRLALSADGRTLAATNQEEPYQFRLWDVRTGQEKHVVSNEGGAYALALSPDGRVAAAGGPGVTSRNNETLRLWDTTTGKQLLQLEGHTGDVSALAFTPDGKTLLSAGAFCPRITLWDVATGKKLRQISGKSEMFLAATFSPDGKVVAGLNADKTITLWDSTGKELRTFGRAPRGLHRVRLWDAAGRMLPGNPPLAFSPDGKLLVGPSVEGYALRLWDVASGEEVLPAEGHLGPLRQIGVSRDGKTAVSAAEENEAPLQVWDLATGRRLRTLRRNPALQGDAAHVCARAVAADGQTAALFGRDLVGSCWDVATGKKLSGFKYESACQSPAFSPDGKVLAYGQGPWGDQIVLREAATGKLLARFRGHRADRRDGVITPAAITSLTFSACGRYLASTGHEDPTVFLWDVTAGKQLRWLRRPALVYDRASGDPSLRPECAAFSPDGRMLATGGRKSDPTIYLWELASGKVRGQLKDPQKLRAVRALLFARDGRTLVSAGEDGVIRFWDVHGGQEVGQLRGHRGAVTCLALLPSGTGLVSGGDDTTLLAWDAAKLLKRERPKAVRLAR
jgi:WD40 repeat protein